MVLRIVMKVFILTIKLSNIIGNIITTMSMRDVVHTYPVHTDSQLVCLTRSDVGSPSVWRCEIAIDPPG